jgi:hypothetical protein
MLHPQPSGKYKARKPWQAIFWLAIFCTILASLLPAAAAQAAPAQAAPNEAAVVSVIALDPTDDARTQAGSPNTNFDDGFLWMGQPNIHFALLKFDLSVLPPDATIEAAGLRLTFTGVYTGANQIEAGRVHGAWEENTLTSSTPVTYTWGGQFKTVTSTGIGDSSVITWNVTPLAQAWHSGVIANDGVALRGNGGVLKAAHSKETGQAGDRGPTLIIAYTLPAEDGQHRPDLGDAPDSSNHHGQNNTAYAAGPVLGQFPTVWDVPAGQAAGPRHLNQSMEGWLGDFLSREGDADQGPDQDTPRNNILRNTVSGAIADVADNDRGDDGWRNRSVQFVNCQRTALDVRISRSPAATRNLMYLNVWFDGNRDGDWADLGQCPQGEDGPAQAGYEWIVQNYIIDMTSIPAGGARNFSVLTEKILNNQPALPHWMRFTLSEQLAVQPGGGQLPDGRGPHPSAAPPSYQFGESEDVLQRPAQAGSLGVLTLQKRVITDADPVEWLDYVTYEIRLRHNGGTRPIDARMHDVLPYPLIVYPSVDAAGIQYVTSTSPTGGAAPLQAQLEVIPASGANPPQQVVKWQGTLAPDAEILFSFQVRVLALCQPNQQTIDFTNTAQAQPKDGAAISAADTFSAKCIGYSEENIDVTSNPISDTIDLSDLPHILWSGAIHNRHPMSVTLGIYQRPASSIVGAAAAELTRTTSLLSILTLAPNESVTLAESIPCPGCAAAKNGNELALPEEYVVDLNLGYCLLPVADNVCPNPQLFPNLHGQIPFTLTVRPNDLGDAPDSSNHAGAAMTAYPGVPANFPTVFDPASGQPQGPRHSYPRPLHLGQFVSREAEADLGPDQDPLNNLRPVANDADNDRGDDGPVAASWLFNHCQQSTLQTRVAVSPQAVNYFQSQGTQAYLNIWIDSNRDGDWADAFDCNGQPAPEHILIDSPVNIAAMGAGLHTIFSQTGVVPWTITDKPAWVRVTLSERPANKTLQAGNVQHGDGRGYAQPFKTGESEDFLFRSQAAGGGPDIDVQMTASSRRISAQEPGFATASADNLGNFEIQIFKIDYANIGSVAADGALLEFQIPEKFHGTRPILVRGAGQSQESISFNFTNLSLLLPHIEQNAFGTVVLGWYGCITCTLASNVTAADAAHTAADYTASVNITVNGDVDGSNNSSSATAVGVLPAPIIGAFMDYTDDSCMDRVLYGPIVTNRTTLQLRGKAAPNQIIAILIGLKQVATVTSDANGNFIYSNNMGGGLLGIRAVYANQANAAGAAISSPRDVASGLPTGQIIVKVDPSLPFDPMSTCFVDSQNRSYPVPMLGYSFSATQTGTWLRSGETYRVSVNGTRSDLNQYFKVTFEDILVSSLRDDDGDGTYAGFATFPSTLQAASANATASLGLIVGGDSGENSYRVSVTSASDGIVTDRTNGQPVANASVSALMGQAASDGSIYYDVWTQSQSGQPNPQVTGSDGKYSFSAQSGLYRIDVTATGYQPYRSSEIDASSASISPNIALAPVINDAATQIIYISETGFTPATASVAPNSVVEFVNVGLSDHASVGGGWDSSLLAPGQSFKLRVPGQGSIPYVDSTDPANSALLIISDSVANNRLFLPIVSR